MTFFKLSLCVLSVLLSGLLGMYMDVQLNFPLKAVYWGIGTASGFFAGAYSIHVIYKQ